MNISNEIIPKILPFIFIGIWVFVSYMISKMGWSDLVEKYKMNNRFTGKRVGIISASVNASNYQNCLILKYNDDGLYLKTTIFFKLFHPPIFIPWTEVKSVREKKILFTRYNELIIGDPFIATIKLRAKTYRKIQNSHLSSIT